MTVDEDGSTAWKVTAPKLDKATEDGTDADVAELDALVPPPRSKRDVHDRMGWGSDRAQKTLARWRELRKPEE
jgi:hypothetical protein